MKDLDLKIACRSLRISPSFGHDRCAEYTGRMIEQGESEVGSKGTCTMPEIRAITVEKHFVMAKSIRKQFLVDLFFCSLEYRFLRRHV